MTRSAPCSSGRWNTGPRNVLSTVTGGRGSPCSRPSHSEASRISRRSTRLLVGFAGVSVTISATRPPRSRASASACAAAVMTASLSQASDTGTARIAEVRQGLLDQRFGSAVERLAHQEHVVRPQVGPERGRDGGHAAREHEARLAALPEREPILQHLEVRVVEAGVHQPGRLTRRRLTPPGRVVEEVLAVLCALEDERGGQEHRRLERALGQTRIVAVAHHLGFRSQHAIADAALVISLVAHGDALPESMVGFYGRRRSGDRPPSAATALESSWRGVPNDIQTGCRPRCSFLVRSSRPASAADPGRGDQVAVLLHRATGSRPAASWKPRPTPEPDGSYRILSVTGKRNGKRIVELLPEGEMLTSARAVHVRRQPPAAGVAVRERGRVQLPDLRLELFQSLPCRRGRQLRLEGIPRVRREEGRARRPSSSSPAYPTRRQRTRRPRPTDVAPPIPADGVFDAGNDPAPRRPRRSGRRNAMTARGGAP